MSEIQLPTYPGAYSETVDPVKRRRTRGDVYEDEFTYSSIHIEEGVADCFPDDAACVVDGNRVYYQYPNKAPVMVDKEGVHRHMDSNRAAAQKQAFFVLSMMDAEGYVSNWGKR